MTDKTGTGEGEVDWAALKAAHLAATLEQKEMHGQGMIGNEPVDFDELRAQANAVLEERRERTSRDL